MIPNRIIQTGKTRDLPSIARASAANFKLLHPNWEHVYFDDSQVAEFMAAESAENQAVFATFTRKIQRFDFFRYLAVYRLGGFYFDLDVFLWSSLDPLLDSNCVVPFEELTLNRYLRTECGTDWEVGNYAFGAGAGHPFLKVVIKNCVLAQRDPEWLKPMMRGIPHMFRTDHYVLNSTGPGLISRTLAENPELAQDVTVLFPENVCNPETWHHFGHYGVHLMDGSWRDRSGFVRRRLTNLWEARTRRRFMPESKARGPTRSVGKGR